MAPVDLCLASMARLSLAQAARPSVSSLPRVVAPMYIQSRRATFVRKVKAKPKRTIPKDFRRPNLAKADFPRFTLCQAMRVLRASEVGHPPTMIKYELHINLKTPRNGPVIRNSIRLPYPVQSDWKIAVICPEGSDIAKAATAAGAVAVGEESLFEAIRKGDFDFDRLLCHESSEGALNKANLGKILGPQGLMPSRRVKTIVDDVARSIRDSAGAVEFRERQGCIHMAIGQLRHTPDQLKANIQAVLKRIKLDCAAISEESPKDISDVILNTTHGPALSLNGLLKSDDDNILPEELTGVM